MATTKKKSVTKKKPTPKTKKVENEESRCGEGKKVAASEESGQACGEESARSTEEDAAKKAERPRSSPKAKKSVVQKPVKKVAATKVENHQETETGRGQEEAKTVAEKSQEGRAEVREGNRACHAQSIVLKAETVKAVIAHCRNLRRLCLWNCRKNLLCQENRYDHRSIEKKWQAKWEADKLYRSVIDNSKPKHYALTMLPYPSGDLHIGHWYAMTPSDRGRVTCA